MDDLFRMESMVEFANKHGATRVVIEFPREAYDRFVFELTRDTQPEWRSVKAAPPPGMEEAAVFGGVVEIRRTASSPRRTGQSGKLPA